MKLKCLDHGYVKLLNLAGPGGPADDIDPAQTARMSFDQRNSEHTREQDLDLADYLLRNRHTTPFEMIQCWWEMQMPIFVARQFVRHRTVSINEISARYTKLPDLFYIPELKDIGVKSKTNKQGRDISPQDQKHRSHAVNITFRENLQNQCKAIYANYLADLANGVPPEIARIQLPLNIYTKWIWRQDLWNTMHFLSLRLHSHAQYETRVYAKAMFTILSEKLPHSMAVFSKHIY